MDAATPAPDLEAMLTRVAELGMRAAEAVTEFLDIERTMVRVAATWLPDPATPQATLADAIAAGQAIDSVNAAMAAGGPRMESLTKSLDRTTRSVRRTVAMLRRLQAGWPRAADSRPAMLRRQVETGVTDKIRALADAHTDAEASENLFADLYERLDDPGLDAELQASSVEVVVARICRDIGLAAKTCIPLLTPPHARPAPARPAPARPAPARPAPARPAPARPARAHPAPAHPIPSHPPDSS